MTGSRRAERTQAEPRKLEALTDDRLLDIAQHGNQRAFEVLSARYRYALFVFCRRRVSDRHTAEDIVQETLLTAWQQLHTCSRWRGWVYTIARNRCATLLRADPEHNGNLTTIPLDWLDSDLGRAPSTSEIHERRAAARELLAATLQLPPRQRQVIGRRLAGSPFPEIAEQLQISQKVARQAAYDARRQIRSILD